MKQSRLMVLKAAPILDGFGLPFDPVRYWNFIQNARIEDYSPTVPDLPVYEGEGCKDRPAGHYEKGSGI